MMASTLLKMLVVVVAAPFHVVANQGPHATWLEKDPIRVTVNIKAYNIPSCSSLNALVPVVV